MNKVILMGRLTRDPEVRYTQTGKVVCQFTLAVDRPFANQEGQREADFIAIVVWGKIAEFCGNRSYKRSKGSCRRSFCRFAAMMLKMVRNAG